MSRYWEQFIELCKNRIFILLCGILLLFSTLVVRLFELQIADGADYAQSTTASVSKVVNVPAPRGNIYDRYGRPLAQNTVAYSVQIDNSTVLELGDYRLSLLHNLTDVLWSKNTTPDDDLPMDASGIYFTFTGDEKEIAEQETAWKSKIGLTKSQMDFTASDCLEYLFEKYEAPESYSEAQKRTYVSLAMTLSDQNLMVLTITEKLVGFGETLSNELPMATEYPYSFQFNNSSAKELNFKESIWMSEEELDYDSLETLSYLQEFFGLPSYLPMDMVRNTVGLRYAIYLQRYQQYQSVTVASDVTDKTLAYIEENNDIFNNVTIDTVSLRVYPEGETFSHILGYIRQMTESDYALYASDVDENGNTIYSSTDIVGQTGVEKLYERELNGTDGKILIEVDSQGRQISELETTEPISGKDVFLTLDSELQRVAFETLEDQLRDAVITKLTTSTTDPLSLIDLFTAMVKANHISATKILTAYEPYQHGIYEEFLAANPDFDPEDEDETAETKMQNYLLEGLLTGAFTTRDAMLIAIEQGTITATEEEIEALAQGGGDVYAMVLNRLQSGDLSPAETALDPCTGSVFVTDVNSGEVLVSVTYPSYDNNELVNVFNNEYYNNLLQDTNTPLVNRPLKQKKAPGSTFKMVTAMAGLETGVITPYTEIEDEGVYTATGTPYARCLIYSNYGITHGMVDLTFALEVSCNYYFYEVAYRLGNAANNSTEAGITTMNEYAAAFGLNSTTGVELEEYVPTMASPYYKERIVKLFNPDATTSQTRWTDGDTIRAAIGQSVNSYTPAQITRYIATLANGGTLYQLHMIDYLQNPDGSVYYETPEIIENVASFDEANVQAIHEGMLAVVEGDRGTMRTAFANFPVQVAGKTGTAEEDINRSSHSWLVCFAPYDDPQIAITVMIPFGEGTGALTSEVAKAIITEYLGLDVTQENSNLETNLTQ
ncbi:penicillin-binding transpeptidase domain-containing protein [Chakrabartyella piscis]|uniref:penicillin-binding transpeptidase domain-containing protein n=1 Tax=Chakrabartyella piscis TaxID=2918914 RepID=UPI0029587609|nr:penicillin-binding transpeptidase domain-containing protein [Chakrabartyella piscis]